MRFTRFGLATLALAGGLFAACKKEPPPPPPPAPEAPPPPPTRPSLSALNLGSAIGVDKRITAAKDTFAVRDTIYASVATTGSAAATKLKAVWTLGAETVRADSLVLDLSGPADSEFHISRPKAWPKGTYQVTITLNDGASMARSFVVK
jgi:hypothetical protein